MGALRRLQDKDPAERQITFLKIGAYSGSIIAVVLILVAMASQKRLLLGLVIAAIVLVISLPLDYWMVRTARRKQATGPSDGDSNGRRTFSGARSAVRQSVRSDTGVSLC